MGKYPKTPDIAIRSEKHQRLVGAMRALRAFVEKRRTMKKANTIQASTKKERA